MLVNTAGLKTTLNAIKEYIRRQIGKIKRPDWNQNDESAQDYIKNRTHWKSEGNERYKRVPLRTILRGHDLLVYIGDRAFVGAFDAQFQEYPFAILATSNDAYFSQIHLNSLNYKSLSLMDASGRIVAKKDLTQAKENKTSDKLISYVVMLEGDDRIPLRDEYNNGYEFTVVLETKTTYHKISQEYLPENVLYSSKQSLTEEQQEQARENITVTKSYQIPTTTINDDKVQVDGWAAAPIGIGRPSGFSIILSDVLNGALPFFVANGTVFLCTGVDSSGAHKVLTVIGFASSDFSAIAYKNALWEDGRQVIYIYPGSVNPNDIEECAQTAYFSVGPDGYIYGQHYEELAGDSPKYIIPTKYPFAVVDGKFNNAVLTLYGISEELKRIVYLRTDATPDGKLQVQGLSVGDKTTPFQVMDIDIPLYIKPADGIPKSDLEQSVQTSLDKADTAISYDSQTLTEEQKSQARQNIGALPERAIENFWSKDHSTRDIRDMLVEYRYGVISNRGDDCNIHGVIINREIMFPCMVLSLQYYTDQIRNLVILDGAGRTLDITVHSNSGVLAYRWHQPILRTWTDEQEPI